jgi:hypothetical protein
MSVRVLKLLIPNKESLIKLPVCAKILSVGLERGNPVFWFEEPDTDCTDCTDVNWPHVDIKFQVVPTGEYASDGMKFIGTLVRPRRNDPTRNAIFHIYVQDSPFIRIN